MKILLLEDEYMLRKSVKELLEDDGHSVEECSSGDVALDMVYANNYDLLLLDVNVPGIKGFELLKELRDADIYTPAIFITSLTEIDNLEKGFGAGCCDYIKKPFDMVELKLRVASVLKTRSLKIDSENVVPLGRYEYNAKSFTLTCDGEEIQLSKTEKMILELFLKNKGQLVTPEMIMRYVWEGDVDPANVRVQINHLRKKLDSDLFVNIRGLGYKLET